MKYKSDKPFSYNRNGEARNFIEISNFKLISLTAVFLVLFGNFSFFRNLAEFYPVEPKNILFIFTIAVMLTCAIIIFFSFFCFKYTTKPVLISILIASSLASYFMNNYNIIIDDTMIQNIIETNSRETFDLIHYRIFFYLFFAGILPAILLFKIKIKYKPLLKEILTKIIVIVCSVLIALVSVFSLSEYYFSFFREHAHLRYYSNPTAYIYSIFLYTSDHFKTDKITMKQIGTDARIPESDTDRELIILVVGETARADRFSLNGYEKETNPLLKKEDVINFPDVHSCGTSTAVSVRCMFSVFTKDEYTEKKADTTHNVLDILNNAGVNILWRDNNSDSKGVALRVAYEDCRTPEKNTICDSECRDEGMLVGLQDYIDSRKTGDILIVLHQKGNHGPAYYKRYPEAFEKFTPVCKTNQLEKCTSEEINNAYDNGILYTDYFLSKVIALLKQNPQFETAMLYFSDHGESLGENNLYLHGMPYFMAPEAQIHIPAIMWFGDGFKINKEILKKAAENPFSHDNLFHSLLGLMEVETALYDENMDILKHATDIDLVENDGVLNTR